MKNYYGNLKNLMHKYAHHNSPILIVVLLGVCSCSDNMFQDDNINDDLNLLSQSMARKYGKIGISDAANEGIDEFYFLAPTVAKSPKFHGKFHPKLPTVVEISDDLEFKHFHQVFTRDDPNNKITVSEADQQYVVNWDTSKSKAEKGKIYRVRVRVGEKVMGYVDVAIVPNKINRLENNMIPVVQNETMRIVYRLEDKTCPARIEVVPNEAKIKIGKTQVFEAKAYNYYGESLNNLKIFWTVGDPKVVSVQQNGIVKGLVNGRANIFANSFDVTGSAEIIVDEEFETFTDPRDGQVYNIIKIGDQIWFAENLNFGGYCYDEGPENCEIFGSLGSINCPEGWHWPSKEDYHILINELGGANLAGGKLKSTNLWNSPNEGTTNESGFSGLPGGQGERDYGYQEPKLSFWGKGQTGVWSTSSSERDEDDNFKRWFFSLDANSSEAKLYMRGMDSEKGYLTSCRCIKD